MHVCKMSRTEEELSLVETGLQTSPERLQAHSCHAPVQTDNQTVSQGGLLSPLSLSAKWLSRSLCLCLWLCLAVSLSTTLAPGSPRDGAQEGL